MRREVAPVEPKDLAARFAENPDSTGAATLFTFFALFTFFYGTFAKMLLRDDREPGEGGAVSSGRWTAALLAGALCIGATAATSQEMDGESFAALAYLRVPFSSNPYLGVMVEKDRIEASRAQARSYEPLWRSEEHTSELQSLMRSS